MNIIKIFVNDDKGYLQWLRDKPKGYVINSLTKPNLKYMKLHSAKCWTIQTHKRTNWTTSGYHKLCSINIKELDEWARTELGGIPKRCKICKQNNLL